MIYLQYTRVIMQALLFLPHVIVASCFCSELFVRLCCLLNGLSFPCILPESTTSHPCKTTYPNIANVIFQLELQLVTNTSEDQW